MSERDPLAEKVRLALAVVEAGRRVNRLSYFGPIPAFDALRNAIYDFDKFNPPWTPHD